MAGILAAGTALWLTASPSYGRRYLNVVGADFATGVVREHNLTAQHPAKDLSEMSPAEIDAAGCRLLGNIEAASQAEIRRQQLAQIGTVGAGCLWLLGGLLLAGRTRARSILESAG